MGKSQAFLKCLTLLVASTGAASLDLLLSWILNVRLDIALFVGFIARVSLGVAFAKAFANRDDLWQRIRLKAGAHLVLLPQVFALLYPSVFTVGLSVIGVILGAPFVWWEELYPLREAEPPKTEAERRENVIRVRIAQLEGKIEPDRQELAKLRTELGEIEQRKGYGRS